MNSSATCVVELGGGGGGGESAHLVLPWILLSSNISDTSLRMCSKIDIQLELFGDFHADSFTGR